MKRWVFGAVFVVQAAFTSTAGSETLLERGDYLVNAIAACGNCHSPQTPEGPLAGMEMAGQFLIEMAGMKAYASNITPDVETGIGAWSDAEIIEAIRNGKRPDGSTIGPPMAFEWYRHISDRDVSAIVAYLRSVPPVRNEIPASTYEFPLPPAYGPSVQTVGEPDHGDLVAYGAYIAGPLGHCLSCHSPIVEGMPDLENQLGAGGQVLDGPWGVSVTANITPHEDGIGSYSDEEIKRAVTLGIAADGTELTPPMGFAYYRNMTDADLNAIVAYLKTLEPLPDP